MERTLPLVEPTETEAEEVLQALREVKGHGFGQVLVKVRNGRVEYIEPTRTYKHAPVN
jgi:hypothetical protein